MTTPSTVAAVRQTLPWAAHAWCVQAAEAHTPGEKHSAVTTNGAVSTGNLRALKRLRSAAMSTIVHAESEHHM